MGCSVHHPFFRTYLSGWIESDVHWGYDLGFDPWTTLVPVQIRWVGGGKTDCCLLYSCESVVFFLQPPPPSKPFDLLDASHGT